MSSQLACALATFADHPDQWDRLGREPKLAVSAAEEVLRFEPAGSGSPRVARFDITRSHAEPMLTFGGGAHYCLGASLARIELQEALAILSQRLPGLTANGAAQWRVGSQIRGPETLPIRFGARASGT